MHPRTPRLSARLRRFYLGSLLVVLWLLRDCLECAPASGPRVLAFQLAVYVTYAALYLLPALALTLALRALFALLARRFRRAPWMDRAIAGAAVAAVTGTVLLLYADRGIYELYGFHMNGFVWNLATTRGGLESLGSTTSTVRSVVAIAAGFLALESGLMWLCGRSWPVALACCAPPRRAYRAAIALFVLLALGERVAYGISEVRAYTPILVAADAFPFYSRVTFRSLAGRLGLETQRVSALELEARSGSLAYPLAPMRVARPERPLNVVWLVSESLRADALQPEIMPASAAFAARALRGMQHYSGGNGTRMGLFSMFYGLHGAYWFSFLRERRGPVLIDVLAEQDYQFQMYTSAHFSYPEFDKTIFARIADARLHECASGSQWERDREGVSLLLDFVAERDRDRPFFTFSFFESPHAPYHFPPESVIREPYLEDFNYATMDPERDLGLIRNRYLNACHHLDAQWARVIEGLEREGLLDSTLVILTGDHGEEFLEHGRWGHNSEFVQEQIRVPLVLWIPGESPREIQAMTGHVDLTATILPRLGVASPASDYTLGCDILGDVHRPFQAISDWSRICFVDADAKISFALKSSGLLDHRATTLADAPRDESAVLAEKRAGLFELMRELGRFRAKEGGADTP